MKNFFKIPFSIFLLLVFVYQCTGYLFVFILIHQNLQQEFSQSILLEENTNNLELIKIEVPVSCVTSPNIHFQLKEKNEFSLDGKMYDFVSFESDGETIVYTCKPDNKEDKIMADFHAHQPNSPGFHRTSSPNKSLKKRLKIFISVYILPADREEFYAFSRQLSFNFLKEKYLIDPSEINSPPPEIYYS